VAHCKSTLCIQYYSTFIQTCYIVFIKNFLEAFARSSFDSCTSLLIVVGLFFLCQVGSILAIFITRISLQTVNRAGKKVALEA
jgi:hypothetical protein